MSLSVAGVWAVGVWDQTVWADGVWREGDYTPGAGGTYPGYSDEEFFLRRRKIARMHQRARQRRRK